VCFPTTEKEGRIYPAFLFKYLGLTFVISCFYKRGKDFCASLMIRKNKKPAEILSSGEKDFQQVFCK